MTNGYALGKDDVYVNELEEAGLTEAHVDLKAFSDDIHRSYTGKSNKPVLRAIEKLNASGIELLVQTVYMPGIVDEAEMDKIAQFLASVNKDMRYRINPFAPVFAFEKVTSRPTVAEMERAYDISSRYLPNVVISRSCYREFPTPPPQKTWITVYPDLTIMKVKFPRALHELTKLRETELVFDGPTTIVEVMEKLVEEYGETFREAIMDQSNENIKRSFNVYLNGMNIKNLQGIKTEVNENAEIIILSWVSGG